MKVALVYDRVNKWGGAERVLLTLHEIFPKAPLYTSVYNPKTAPWASVFPKIETSFLQELPFAKTNHEGLAMLMPLAFEAFDFSQFDLVISVTSEAAKGIVTKPKTRHLCYCLTPTRYLWSHHSLYFQNKLFKRLVKPVISYLRNWDQVAAQRPDAMVAISTAVQKRINKYYDRDSEIIFPPSNFQFSMHNFQSNSNFKVFNYYLLVSRLVNYKKVDLAIRAFNRLHQKLIIVGSGREERKLKSISASNIKFIKNLTDGELAAYYKNCRALIHPQEEDFGLAAVEAQVFGKPVIAYQRGGAPDIVIDGKTGVFFKRQTEKSLIGAIDRFEKMSFNSQTIRDNAQKFTKEIFKKNFLRLINND